MISAHAALIFVHVALCAVCGATRAVPDPVVAYGSFARWLLQHGVEPDLVPSTRLEGRAIVRAPESWHRVRAALELLHTKGSPKLESDLCGIAVFLALEAARPDSAWRPYLDMLPRRPGSGLYFTDWESQLAAERLPRVDHELGALNRAHAQCERAAMQVLGPWLGAAPPTASHARGRERERRPPDSSAGAPAPTRALMRWAFATAVSRTVYLKRLGEPVVPTYLCLANHRADGAHLAPNRGQALTVQLLAPAEGLGPGDEVWATYGDKPNAQLAVGYGFAVRPPQPEEGSDSVSLSIAWREHADRNGGLLLRVSAPLKTGEDFIRLWLLTEAGWTEEGESKWAALEPALQRLSPQVAAQVDAARRLARGLPGCREAVLCKFNAGPAARKSRIVAQAASRPLDCAGTTPGAVTEAVAAVLDAANTPGPEIGARDPLPPRLNAVRIAPGASDVPGQLLAISRSLRVSRFELVLALCEGGLGHSGVDLERSPIGPDNERVARTALHRWLRDQQKLLRLSPEEEARLAREPHGAALRDVAQEERMAVAGAIAGNAAALQALDRGR